MENTNENYNYKIYVHINKINGKMYIGQTRQTLRERFKYGHGYIGCKVFYRAIQKYGWNNFEHILVMDNLTYEMADIIEQELIKKYKTMDNRYGYNRAEGGQGVRGLEISEETRNKMRQSHIGKTLSEEQKTKIGNALRGRPLSEEFKLKLRTCKPFRHVYQIDVFDGHIINEFDSCEDVSRQFNTPEANICRCCNDKKGYMTVAGYIWMYIDDYDIKIKSYEWRKLHGLVKINQYDLNMTLIKTWDSIKQIERDLGIRSNLLKSALDGYFKTLKGFVWEYNNDNTGDKDYDN